MTVSGRNHGFIRFTDFAGKCNRTGRRTKTMRMAFAALLCAALGLGAAACGDSNDGISTGDDTQKISFMLDWSPNTNHIGLYVAQKLGYFKQAGIDVTILPAAQAGAETSVENGIADVGFSSLSNVASYNTQGADLRLVFDLTQKPIAQWCALASRKDIVTPKDFSGKTFVSFGSPEEKVSARQMITYAGGTGEFKTATAGTNTFATLTSGKGDFAGFYATWEGVESKLNGPALHCFKAQDWGIPGNPDQLGYVVNGAWLKDSAHKKALRGFLAAAIKGYDYALAHPQKASDLMVATAKAAQLDPKLVKASMDTIISNNYWTTAGATHVTGAIDATAAQDYLDFQYKAGTYDSNKGTRPDQAPQASELASNAYLS